MITNTEQRLPEKPEKQGSHGNFNKNLFTGQIELTIKKVNPTLSELNEIRSYVSDRTPVYTNISMKNGGTFSKVEFFFEFNPSKQLGGDNDYSESIIVSYPVYINKDLNFNTDRTKIQLIDGNNKSTYVAFKDQTSARKLLEEEQLIKSNFYLDQMDPETVRFAHVGEKVLYDVLWCICSYPKNMDLKGQFIIGDSSDNAFSSFESLVDGNFEILQSLIDSEFAKYADGSSTQCGGLLGIKRDPNNPDRYYQELFDNKYTCCLYRLDDGRTQDVIVDKSDLVNPKKEKTFLNKDAANVLNGSYSWDYWTPAMGFKLQQFDPKHLKPLESQEEDYLENITSGQMTGVTEDEDDLPF